MITHILINIITITINAYSIPMYICTQVMDRTLFPCGKLYFEVPRRMFAQEHPCPECIAILNNGIEGTAAKIYRWRAHTPT